MTACFATNALGALMLLQHAVRLRCLSVAAQPTGEGWMVYKLAKSVLDGARHTDRVTIQS